MTIFDTIRFPNPDIFDKDDLDKLPRGLLELWVVEITKGVKYPFDLDITDLRNDFSKIAYNTVITKVSATRTTNFKSETILIGACKKQFTDLLKKMLGEFESPA
jgi:hypothetical protein